MVSPFLPSFWKGRRYIRQAKDLLGPRIGELLEKNDNGTWSPRKDPEDSNIFSWLIDAVKGKDRTPDTIAHVQVVLALASVHTTLIRMVNVLYDLVADGPKLVEELRVEIEALASSSTGWREAPYDKLLKLDSVCRESQRMSPPTTLGLKRLFHLPYTFKDGLHIPQGTYVCLPVYAIKNDPEHTRDPEIFDGLRNYRLLLEKRNADGEKASKEYAFTSPSQTALGFGYGKSACPGRFFASMVIKMVLVKCLTEYDFQFLDWGSIFPTNLQRIDRASRLVNLVVVDTCYGTKGPTIYTQRKGEDL